MLRRSLLGFIALVVLALLDLPATSQENKSGPATLDARVAALMAMPAKERRAYLKALKPEERRGLWFQLKRQQAIQKGKTPAKRGQGLTRHKLQVKGKAPVSPKSVGTIQYDDGISTVVFGGGAIIGNRFNTHTGNPVLASGTVSTIVGVVVQGPAFTTASAGFVLEGPQTTGGGAQAIFSAFTSGLTATTETVSFTGIGANYTGNSFFALFGDFANSYIPAFGTGSTQGQGHHGVVGYTGGMGPNITSTFDFGGTLNGLVRASGNILPVELMKFKVE